MAVDGVGDTPYSSSDNTNQVSNKSYNDLGESDFLKLLVAQLKNQDPMSPTDNTQFVAQLAQFSTLEQMSNMAASMSALQYNMNQSLLTQGASLIGKEAVAVDSKGVKTTGVITSVSWLNGSLAVMLGDKLTSIDDIMEIKEPGSADPPASDDPAPTDPAPTDPSPTDDGSDGNDGNDGSSSTGGTEP